MLACAGLGDDPFLAYSLGKESLAQCVVNLVCPGIGQPFEFDIDTAPTEFLRSVFRKLEGCGSSYEIPMKCGEGFQEIDITHGFGKSVL